MLEVKKGLSFAWIGLLATTFYLTTLACGVAQIGPAGSLAPTPEPSAATPAPKPAPSASKLGFPTEVATPLKVGVALTWNTVAKVNELTSTFEGSVDLRLRWCDPRLAFDVKEAGTDRQEFGGEAATAKLGTIWNPQLTLANMNDKPIRNEPGLFIYADGTVVYIQRIRAIFEVPYKLAGFPFDRQNLSVKLLSTRYSAAQLALVQEQKDLDQSGVREGARLPGWEVLNTGFNASRARGWNGDFFPQCEVALTVLRQSTTHILIIFIPLFSVLFIPTLLTLYAKADVAPRLGAWSGSILALIALNFTLTVRYPALDSHSLVAQVVAIGLCYQLLMVFLTMTALNLPVAQRVVSKDISLEIEGFLRWGVPIALVVLVLTRVFLTALSLD